MQSAIGTSRQTLDFALSIFPLANQVTLMHKLSFVKPCQRSHLPGVLLFITAYPVLFKPFDHHCLIRLQANLVSVTAWLPDPLAAQLPTRKSSAGHPTRKLPRPSKKFYNN
jgi:hypothetical protein